MKQLFLLLLAAALPLSRASAEGLLHSSILANTENALVKAGGAKGDARLISGKKYLFIYFSAHWCPPCRAFTPKLVQFYKQNLGNADFGLLFVSSDNDQASMNRYMSETQMPWSGLELQNPKTQALKKQFGVNGIPCLVLLDEKDQVVASSYKGGTYLGPQEALNKYMELHKDFKRTNVDPVNNIIAAGAIKGAKVSTSTNTDNRIFIGGKVVSSTNKGDNVIMIGGKVPTAANAGGIVIGKKVVVGREADNGAESVGQK